jgi:aspartate aminotransferase
MYEHLVYGDFEFTTIAQVEPELYERTLTVNGVSKAYAMTGWRIGAALAPPHLTKAMAALQSHTTTGANQPAMWAAALAFSDEKVDAEVTRMVAAFRRRRDVLVERFRREAPGIEFVEPHGAFYFFFRVDGIRERDPLTGSVFCEQLMKQEGVALVPGGAFGDDRWVRLSYAVSDSELERALDKIFGLIHRLASARAA